ncbi:DUF6684 family protein [Halomarina pelagica]|uniref:DUF6684 family protein n=1 Tax=Halomarina pelagica TaxID=2961599 RepID=UPI0020C42C9C|nr:DUF6684 family protein [Halomarina sp. BND7]
MASDVFDRETLLDLSVNIIPLFIIVFFVGVFLVLAPFGYSPVDTTIQMGLLVAPFLALAILTYYAGKAIAEAEGETEARESEPVAGAVEGSSGDLEPGDDEATTTAE